MQNLFSTYSLEKFKIKPPSKNDERKRLIAELSEVSGWNKRAIHFSFLGLPESWIQDALRECRHFSNPKLRNKKLGDFLKEIKSKK